MPRANRYFIPGHVWHITQRCHKQEFLLKFARDRHCLIHWLYQATRRYDLRVLNYIVTSNHIHLLVMDDGKSNIPKSLQLIAGCTAQQYNRRKQRKGAYWEDRYHATAIEGGEHLARCLVYIDMNMVRAGVVSHPSAWLWSGYHEIQTSPQRKGIIDLELLKSLWNLKDIMGLQALRQGWVEEALLTTSNERNADWTNNVAVGGKAYIEAVKAQLGLKVRARKIVSAGEGYAIQEENAAYNLHFDAKNH
ncbi:Transposase and inactivated derivatives [hydrothermal vent metagenome]|uniref:Transposase and inactivated derivatives n=1 Tax=hydrothermal vent metagenome TaxID=652676 RepID=A0A3B0ZWP0_9ZZZZ